MDHIQLLIVNFAAIMASMVVLWILSVALRNAGIIDVFWGAGFVIVAWLSREYVDATAPRVLLLACLTTVWGLRLAAYILSRNLDNREDYRYAAMRKRQGPRFWWLSLFTVFGLQGVLLWFISLPLQIAAGEDVPTPLGWVDAIGTLLVATGLFFETVGDWQLARFKTDPRNADRVMDRGLWRYTRHPNYFGDFCVWWGLYLIASAGGAGWTLLSPLLMSALLLKVSGVAHLESTITDRRPEYADYQQRTNAFFPGPPR